MMSVSVYPDGTLKFIYDDQLRALLDHGSSNVRRASHVEPEVMPDGSVLWYADMGPSGGPVFTGFRHRQAALDAEVRWLQENEGL